MDVIVCIASVMKKTLPPHQPPASLHPPTSLFRRVAILDQGLHAARPVLARPCLTAMTMAEATTGRIIAEDGEVLISTDALRKLRRLSRLSSDACTSLRHARECLLEASETVLPPADRVSIDKARKDVIHTLSEVNTLNNVFEMQYAVEMDKRDDRTRWLKRKRSALARAIRSAAGGAEDVVDSHESNSEQGEVVDASTPSAPPTSEGFSVPDSGSQRRVP